MDWEVPLGALALETQEEADLLQQFSAPLSFDLDSLCYRKSSLALSQHLAWASAGLQK